MSARGGRHRWSARLLAVALGLLVALGLAELGLRLTGAGFHRPRSAEYHFVSRPGERFWRLDPQRPPEHAWDGDPYGVLPPGARLRYPIGAHGYRGDPPPPGRPRVLVVGDSFTFGEGVAEPDTFAARLGRAFAGRSPPPAVVNAGVPGYGTQEEAALLPELLAAFDPRLVLLVVVPNDAVPLADALAAPDGINVRDAGPPSGLRLWALLRGVVRRSEAERALDDWYLSYHAGARAAHGRAADAALASMLARLREAGRPAAVALFPLLHRLKERPLAAIHDACARRCRAEGVPFLDLSDALAGEPERRLWVHPTDHHPNARAHELAAAALAPFLEPLLE